MLTRDYFMLEKIEKTMGKNQQFSIIWLHGLGADGSDFEAIIPELNLPSESQIKFIFPHAPIRPITINNGFEMRGWYDISNLASIDADIDVTGIESSIAEITKLIEKERKNGILAENIILAGFSQGGVIAALTGLIYKEKLGGLLLLSTYLPKWDYFKEKLNTNNLSMPVTIAHGLYDPIVPFRAGEYLKNQLDALNMPVSFYNYPMEHSICPEEIHMIRDFFCQTLNLECIL